jgi:hypothetical protein
VGVVVSFSLALAFSLVVAAIVGVGEGGWGPPRELTVCCWGG